MFHGILGIRYISVSTIKKNKRNYQSISSSNRRSGCCNKISLPVIVLEETENPSDNNKTSSVVLALKTEDLHHTVEWLKKHKVDFIIDKPTKYPPGKYISFRDPFGNVLEYLQFE